MTGLKDIRRKHCGSQRKLATENKRHAFISCLTTKQVVLQAINSARLIHYAAYGNAERGETALSPECAINYSQED